VSSEDSGSFAYARTLRSVVAAPGTTVEAGTLDPAPIPSVAIPLRANGDDLTDWTWSIAVDVVVPPAGRAFGFAASGARASLPGDLSLELPHIPDATLRATATATPSPFGDVEDPRSSEGWSGIRALATNPVTLDLSTGPETVQPVANGSLSRGAGFAWRGSAPGTTILVVADVARSLLRFRVVTSADSVALARLRALDIADLLDGAHVLDLGTSSAAAIDDLVSPDPALRHRGSDRSQPGSATSVRIPFEVVP
jgi:hypothetical protein